MKSILFQKSSLLTLFLTAGLIVFGSGCESTTAHTTTSMNDGASTSPPRIPPTEYGVILARTGDAVLEVKMNAVSLYDLVEFEVKKNLMITRQSRPFGMDAENATHLFVFNISPLTSGKTALSVFVQERSTLNPDYMTAVACADSLAKIIQQGGKPAAAFRTQELQPRILDSNPAP